MAMNVVCYGLLNCSVMNGHQSNYTQEADKLTLLSIILLLADVSSTYSSVLPQGNIF